MLGLITPCFRHNETMCSFPLYPVASALDVELVLETLAMSGWQVFARPEPGQYVISLDSASRIELKHSTARQTWDVKARKAGSSSFYGQAGDVQALKQALKQAGAAVGYDLQSAPTTLRLADNTPASNRIGLVHLAAGTEVTAVFDPYFDDRAVANLVTLVRLGLKLRQQLRILCTSKSTSRLSGPLVADAGTELGVSLAVRVCQSSAEHRRFLLLAGGTSLVLGCSLNDLTKNEAAHVEPSATDQAFFQIQWQSAQPWV